MSETLPNYLTHLQVDNLLKTIDRWDFKSRSQILLMLGGGLRISEVAHLHVADLVLHRQQVHVRLGKGSKDRTVFISDDCITSIRSHLNGRTEGFVFRGRDPDTPISSRALRKSLRKIFDMAGIPKAKRIHDLRHTCAVRMLQDMEYSLRFIQDHLGHSSIKITEKYLKVTGKDRENEHQRRGGVPY